VIDDHQFVAACVPYPASVRPEGLLDVTDPLLPSRWGGVGEGHVDEGGRVGAPDRPSEATMGVRHDQARRWRVGPCQPDAMCWG
jgi:hypothetical protein